MKPRNSCLLRIATSANLEGYGFDRVLDHDLWVFESSLFDVEDYNLYGLEMVGKFDSIEGLELVPLEATLHLDIIPADSPPGGFDWSVMKAISDRRINLEIYCASDDSP